MPMFASIAGVLLELGIFGVLSLIVLSSLFVIAIAVSGNKRQFVYPEKFGEHLALLEE